MRINNSLIKFLEGEKQNLKNSPFALSISLIVDNKIEVLYVSKETLILFKKENSKVKKLLNKLHLINLSQLESFLKDDQKKEKNIIYKVELEEKKTIFINEKLKKIRKKEYSLVYSSYFKVEEQTYYAYENDTSCFSCKIMNSSSNSINIISKEGYHLLFANKESLKNSLNKRDYIEGELCYKYFFNKEKPCNVCLLSSQKKEDDIYIKEIDKYFKVKVDEILWKGQEAYIVYYYDITLEKKIEKEKEEDLISFEKVIHKILNKRSDSENNFISFIELDITSNKLIFNNSKEYKELIDFVSLTEVSNHIVKSFVLEEDKEAFLNLFERNNLLDLAKKGERTGIKYLRKFRDGTFHNIYLEIEFITHPLNKHYLAFVYGYDITTISESETLLNAIVNVQNDFVLNYSKITNEIRVFAKKDNFLNLKQGFSSLSCNTFNSIISNFIIDKKAKTKADKIDFCKYIIDKIKTKNPFINYFEYLEDNNELVVKRFVSFVEDEKSNSVITVAYDISDVIKNERNNKRDLEDALEVAEFANKTKTKFLSRMSHNMRTPMNAIICLSQFGLDEKELKDSKKYFEQINMSGKYLLGLLNDVLDLQEIEKGELRLTPSLVELDKLYSSINSLIKKKAFINGLEYIFENNCRVENNIRIVDSNRIEQILVNILNNSIKYTKKGGFISFKINEKFEGDKYFALYKISDNGIGIEKNFLLHIYESFTRESNEIIQNDKGNGLGLAIVKALIDKMGGQIFCESQKNIGTVFTIKIPMEIPSKTQLSLFFDKNKVKETIKELLENKKILLCEDNEINARIIFKIFEKWGIIVDYAENGEVGVQKAKYNKYDFILMDIRMPILNGLEASLKIREFDKDIPIIALSANAFEEDVKKSFDCGLNAHLSKPINFNLLFTTIENLLLNKNHR